MNRLLPGDWVRRHKIAAIVLALALAALAVAVSITQLARGDAYSRRLFDSAVAAHKAAEDRLQSNEIVEADRLCRQAIESLDKLTQRSTDRRYRLEQGAAFETLAMIQIAASEPVQVHHAFRQAINVLGTLLAQDPSAVIVRRRIAGCLHRHADWLRESSRWEEAEKTLERGIDLCGTRLTTAPIDRQVEHEAVLMKSDIGLLFLRRNHPAEAMQTFDEAVTMQKRLMQAASATSDDRELLISLLLSQAKTFSLNKRPDDAVSALTDARDLVEGMSSDFPSTDRYHDLSATVLETLGGEIQRDPNRAAVARGLLERALTIRESLVAGSPSSPVHLERLAGTSGRLADSWLDAKSFDQAERYQRKELSYQSRLHQENPGVPAFRFGRGRALHNLADFLSQRGRAEEALPLERQAVELLSSVYHENVTDTAHRQAVSSAYWTLAALEIDRKDHRAAAKTVSSYLAIEPNGFEEAREAAGFLCRCIVLCRLDQGIPAAERESLARACSDQAIAALQTAVSYGFRDLNDLKNSRTYDPLRDRPEFARVVHDVEAFLDAFNDR